MKSFKKKLSTIVLATLSCCGMVNADKNVIINPKVQDASSFPKKERKRNVKDILLTGAKWGFILGAPAGLAFAADDIITGTSVFDAFGKKLDKSYIEEHFDEIISPYWDVNYFKNGGPNNAKEYLVEIMTDGIIKYREIFEKDPEISEILAYSLSFDFGFYKLFNSKLVKNDTVAIIVFNPSNKDNLSIKFKGKDDEAYKNSLGKRITSMIETNSTIRSSDERPRILDLPPIELDIAKSENGSFLCMCNKVKKT